MDRSDIEYVYKKAARRDGDKIYWFLQCFDVSKCNCKYLGYEIRVSRQNQTCKLTRGMSLEWAVYS